MNEFPKIILKHSKDEVVRRFHPWIFSGAIKAITGNPQDGDVVEIYSDNQQYLATGHYQTGSIAVKIFSHRQVVPDYSFWKSKIQAAYDLRKKIGLVDQEQTNVYRLIFTEGDGMPGLIVDIYGRTAVLQSHSVGMHNIKNHICNAITEIYGDKIQAIFDKSADTMQKMTGINTSDQYLFGNKINDDVVENGHKFSIDWETGQKTGFFIDQRQNRQLVAQYSDGKKVLNCFSYTGAFSVYALKAGATMVHSVDSSKKAIELTEKNIFLNNLDNTRHQSFNIDAKKFLPEMPDDYDLIILDPPAFAKHLHQRHQAIKGYKQINYQAIKKIKSGGILFTFSCSQAIDRNLFTSTVISAAIETGRDVKILHQLSQPPDHPINAFHNEGEYLKGLVLYIK
ncbi:MAG TPA: class I SAM-dependent rRNA methyltransferase [Bacteroidales bacterium]|nr:class I SAM-dependent rRNA methyltransferase [Bacteroidales bacterium]